jgi:hypothetical protein
MNLVFKSGRVTKALNSFVVFIFACTLTACGAGDGFTGNVNPAQPVASTPLFTTAPSSIMIATGAEPSYGIGGGTAPFKVISNDVSVATLTVTDKAFTLKGVKGGAATLVLSDAAGSTKSIEVTVTPMATTPMLVTPAAVSASVGDVLYFRVSGGAPAYEVLVNNASIAMTSTPTVTTSGGTFSLNLLKVGSTTIAITDTLGQTQTVTLTVASSTGSTALFTTAPSSITIATGAQPSYSIGGGSAPVKVVSNDVSVAAVLSFNDTEFKLQGVKGGAATVVISDSTGATKSVQVTVTPTATTPMLVSPSVASASVGDELVFKVSGGKPGYGVQVNNTSIANTSSSTVSTSGDTFSLNLLKVGSTTIAITDGLEQTQTVTLTVDAAFAKLRLAPSALTIDENFTGSIAFSIYGGVPGALYTVQTSDELLFTIPKPSKDTSFLAGPVVAGNRCIVPNNVSPARITDSYDVQITVFDQTGASAVSVVSIRDNARGCPLN